MANYGFLEFKGYKQQTEVFKFAMFTQFVDNPNMDKDSLTYQLFEYGKERSLNYQVPFNQNVEDVLNEYLFAKIIRIISHEPIITPRISFAMKLGAMTLEQVSANQLLRYEDGIQVDEFGLPIYTQNLLVLDRLDVEDQDWRGIEDFSKIIVEGKARTII